VITVFFFNFFVPLFNWARAGQQHAAVIG
jgi:hypothetical protein